MQYTNFNLTVCTEWSVLGQRVIREVVSQIHGYHFQERVHNFFLLTFLKNSWSPLISDSTTENLVEWLTWPSGQTSLYFLSTIADKCKRGGPYQYIYMNRDATKSFFPFTLATTRISWSGRGGCFKHEWSKWRHQTEFSRKLGVVFSLVSPNTHIHTK